VQVDVVRLPFVLGSDVPRELLHDADGLVHGQSVSMQEPLEQQAGLRRPVAMHVDPDGLRRNADLVRVDHECGCVHGPVGLHLELSFGPGFRGLS
jgi:hypothetical protein